MTTFWPCPNNCISWCRSLQFKDWNLAPTTNHHPNCEHVDASLIDVYSVRIPGESSGCVTDCERLAYEMANEDKENILEVVKLKMHKEVYENLGGI